MRSTPSVVPAPSLRRRRQLLFAWLGLLFAAAIVTLTSDARLSVFALGLLVPGAGFLATGAWLYAVGAMAVFALAVMVWFGTGNVFAPVLVWLGSAFAATITLAPDAVIYPAALAAIAVIPLLVSLTHGTMTARNGRAAKLPRPEVTTWLPPAIPVAAKPDTLGQDDLARLRLLLDRALQPVENFDGFDHRDQFQTGALRYQVNFASYALSLTQARFMPAFAGYMSESQNTLALKLQDRRLWGYWKWENLWGNLRRGWDPIPHENIMFSGFVAAQLALAQKAATHGLPSIPDALVLRAGTDTRRYTVSAISCLLADQYATSGDLLACEPNWVYPMCNLITACGIRAATPEDWQSITKRFLSALQSGYVRPDGRLVPFHSRYLGLSAPAIGGAVMQGFPCLFLNALSPELAQRQWQVFRAELHRKGIKRALWPVDVGNYRLTRAAGIAASAAAAREMGDEQTASELLAMLDAAHPAQASDGSAHRPGVSFWSHSVEMMARVGLAGGLSDLVVGQKAKPRNPPILKSVPYPQCLVGACHHSTDRLEAVMIRSSRKPPSSVVIAALRPGRDYEVNGARLRANPHGELALTLHGSAETRLILSLAA